MGGLGKRLEIETKGLPKPMVDVCGKPFFRYQLELLKWNGFKRFVFCTGHRAEAIEEYFGNGGRFGVSIEYSDDGDRLLGTAGALKKAQSFFEKDLMAIYGDSFMDIDYEELLCHYASKKHDENCRIMMAVLKNRNQYERSNVIFKNGRVVVYDKKRPSSKMDYVDYGVSVMDRGVLSDIPAGEAVDLSDVYHDLARRHLLLGHEVYNRFYEIGTPHSLDEFRGFVEERFLKEKPAVFLDRDGTINESVRNAESEAWDSPFDENQLKLLPKVPEALRLLQSMGYRLIVATNQPAAAKGKASLAALYRVNHRLNLTLKESGVELDALFACYHHPVGAANVKDSFLIHECDCRKPKPGLLKKATEKLNIDLGASYMVGDSEKDVLAGKAMGLKTVFVGNPTQTTDADHRFKDLYDFALFLKREQ